MSGFGHRWRVGQGVKVIAKVPAQNSQMAYYGLGMLI